MDNSILNAIHSTLKDNSKMLSTIAERVTRIEENTKNQQANLDQLNELVWKTTGSNNSLMEKTAAAYADRIQIKDNINRIDEVLSSKRNLYFSAVISAVIAFFTFMLTNIANSAPATETESQIIVEATTPIVP